MARIPTQEDFLFQLQQAAGNPDVASKFSTQDKKDFLKPLTAKQAVTPYQTVIDSIAKSYDIDMSEMKNLDLEIVSNDKDAESVKNLVVITKDFFDVVKSFEKFGGWTFNATQKQVIYEIAKYILPVWARRYGFFNFNFKYFKNMPHASLWFLPYREEKSETLKLPMQIAVEWWVSLLDCTYEKIWSNEHSEYKDYVRTLQNWKAGNILPKNNQKVKELFTDNIEFKYKKDLTYMPSNLELRRIFTTARIAQDVYQKMCDLLYADKKIYFNANPVQNKVLQLIELFKISYNITIQTNDEDDNKAYTQFNDAVPEWLKQSYFKGMIHHGISIEKAEEQAMQFQDKMLMINHDTPLDDIFHNGIVANGQAIISNQSNEIANKRKQFNEEIVEKLKSEVERGQTSDSETKADALIDIAIKHDEYEAYKAIILYSQSIHALRQNKFDDALKFAEEAFDECVYHNSYGDIWKKTIARFYISLYLSFNHYDVKKLEKYAMIVSDSIDDINITDENGNKLPLAYISDQLAFTCEKQCPLIFKIYHPYPSYERKLLAEEVSKEFFTLSLELDENGQSIDIIFNEWAKEKQNHIEKKQVPYNRSFLISTYYLYKKFEDKKIKINLIRLIKQCPLKILNAQDYLNKTLLIYAVEDEEIEIVEALLQQKVNVNIQDHVKKTALHRSIAKKNIKIFELLIANKAALDIKDAFNETPMDDINNSNFLEAKSIL